MYRKSRVPSRAMTPAGGATLASPPGGIVADCGGTSYVICLRAGEIRRVETRWSRARRREKPPGAFCQLSTRLSRRRAAGSLGRAVPTGPGRGGAPRKPKIEARSRLRGDAVAPATRRRLERQIWPRPMKSAGRRSRNRESGPRTPERDPVRLVGDGQAAEVADVLTHDERPVDVLEVADMVPPLSWDIAKRNLRAGSPVDRFGRVR